MKYRFVLILLIAIAIPSATYCQDASLDLWFTRVDSSSSDISHFNYSSNLDTTKGAIEYDSDNKPVDVEPTFADRYYKNKSIDSSGYIRVSKAYTAREIAKSIIADKLGNDRLIEIHNYDVIFVDNKFWCVIFSLDENAYGGTNVILISKYDGRIMEWSNLK